MRIDLPTPVHLSLLGLILTGACGPLEDALSRYHVHGGPQLGDGNDTKPGTAHSSQEANDTAHPGKAPPADNVAPPPPAVGGSTRPPPDGKPVPVGGEASEPLPAWPPEDPPPVAKDEQGSGCPCSCDPGIPPEKPADAEDTPKAPPGEPECSVVQMSLIETDDTRILRLEGALGEEVTILLKGPDGSLVEEKVTGSAPQGDCGARRYDHELTLPADLPSGVHEFYAYFQSAQQDGWGLSFEVKIP